MVCTLFLGMVSAVSAQEQYTYINQTLRARSWGDYPIVLSNEVQGGIHHVDNIAEANSIPLERRLVGMLCVVGDVDWSNPADNSIYMWQGPGLTDWIRVNYLRVWESGFTYQNGEVVLYNAKMYIATQAVPTTADSPDADVMYWIDLQSGLADLSSHIQDVSIHRSINDASTSDTVLWSANRIISYADSLGAEAGEGLSFDSINNRYHANVTGGLTIADDSIRINTGAANQFLTMNAAGTEVEWKSVTLNATTVTYKTAAATLTTDEQGVILCNNAGTITLPATPEDGTMYRIKSVGTNAVDILGNGTTIDGFSSTRLVEQYASISVIYYGSVWYVTDKQSQKSVYLGNPTQTGSWRITVVSTTNQLRFEQFDGANWIYKLEVED